MDSRKDKIEKLFQRPRETLGSTDRPGLPEHISTDELLEFLIPHLFGKHFPKGELLPTPYSIVEHPFLSEAIETGKVLVACATILEALKANQLTLLVASLKRDGGWGSFHRFAASDFGEVKAFNVKPEFLVGEAFAPFSAFPDWAVDKTFFFYAEQVEDWLRLVEPLAYLPAVVGRDGALLPERAISPSEAICWVAGQEILDWYDLINRGADLQDTIFALKGLENGDYDQSYYQASQELCELLAERHQRSHASNEILRLMRNEALTGHGVLRRPERPGIKGQIEAIPQNAFLVRREFSVNEDFEDCLVAAFTGDHSEDRLAADQADWAHVRFNKADLIGIWGAESQDQSPEGNRVDFQNKPERSSPGGRRPKYDWDGLFKHLDELWEYHGPLDESDPDWGRLADIKNAAKKWFIEQIDDHPSETSLHDNVRPWLDKKLRELGKGR